MRKFILITLLFSIFGGCQKDENYVDNQKNTTSESRSSQIRHQPKFSILDAKTWYENETQNGLDLIKNCVEPYWQYSTFPNSFQGNVLFAPIGYENGNYSPYYSEHIIVYKENNNFRKKRFD